MRSRIDPFSITDYYRPQDFDIVDRITEVAQKRGVNNAQVAMAWVLQKPGITAPILGANKSAHIDDAIAAISLNLSTEEIKILETPYQPRAVLGHL